MKKQSKKKLIYVRYILPVAVMLLSVVAMLIPTYRYIADGALKVANSTMGFMIKAVSDSRQTLFGAEDYSAGALAFSKAMIVWIAIFVILFLIALISAVYSLVVAIKYFAGDDDEAAEKSRTLFVTFFPNRIILCAAELLALPMTLFPYFLPLFYKNFLGEKVVFVLLAPDAFILTTLGLIAVIVLSCVCAPIEREFGADVFNKEHKEDKSKEKEYSIGEKAESKEAESKKAVRDEGINEIVRKLLSDKKDDNEEN